MNFSTKELSTRTWQDFEKLFRKPGEWDPCWCVYYHRARPLPGSRMLHTRAKRAVRNRREHRSLVEEGCAHGVLVYSRGEPVGWCQYGPKEELPRIDAKRNYRGLNPPSDDTKLWRITCFVVDRKYRGWGVAGVALKAALKAIRTRGGGLVEASDHPLGGPGKLVWHSLDV